MTPIEPQHHACIAGGAASAANHKPFDPAVSFGLPPLIAPPIRPLLSPP